jgi:Response regulator containing CheY-like receiver domain and AraC-type DNA-binding domain
MGDILHIAIADDDSVTREFLFRALQHLGHEVVCTAENGRQLVDYCLRSPPDLVITDFQMPQLDGISAAAEIAGQHEIPIIILSGTELPRRIEQLSSVHTLFHRLKPISRGDLEVLLNKVIDIAAVAS